MDTIAIIPARGGSKGIPNKNIQLLNGYPLIAYSISSAILSKKIERVLVSTDSEEIAEIAVHYGAEVPFLRPAEYASDTAIDRDVVIHAMEWIRNNEKDVPEYCIYAGVPAKRIKSLTDYKLDIKDNIVGIKDDKKDKALIRNESWDTFVKLHIPWIL